MELMDVKAARSLKLEIGTRKLTVSHDPSSPLFLSVYRLVSPSLQSLHMAKYGYWVSWVFCEADIEKLGASEVCCNECLWREKEYGDRLDRETFTPWYRPDAWYRKCGRKQDWAGRASENNTDMTGAQEQRLFVRGVPCWQTRPGSDTPMVLSN